MSETKSGTPKLNAALAKAQAKFPAAEKNALNPAFKDASQPTKKHGTKYADLSSVIAATRPALTENGLAVSQEVLESPEGWVKVRTCLLHESGEERASVLSMPCAVKTPHAYGAAISYARRYGYNAMTGAVADDDDDGNAASGKADSAAKSSAPATGDAVDDGNAASGKADSAAKSSAPATGDAVEREKSLIRAQLVAARCKADVDALARRFNALPEADKTEMLPELKKRKAELPEEKP